MPNPDVYLSIVVPAYNESERIPKTLRRFNEYLMAQPFSYEILVVNDGSRDGTGEIVDRMKGEIKNMRLINRQQNRGKGFTVREGMLSAYGKICLFADADNSTDIAHFEKMRPLFDQGCDVVICSRNEKDVPGAKHAVKQPTWKRILGTLGNLYIQYMAVPGIWDTQCGFKAFRDYAAIKIFTTARVDRWSFDVEALALARKLDYKICAVAAYWIDDPNTHVSFTSYFKTLWEVYKINRNLKKGKYKIE